MDHQKTQEALREIADPTIAKHSKHYFKTGSGEYGEGDQFLGIRVPRIRKVAKRFKELPLPEVEKLLHSDFHEERLCALIILVYKMRKADAQEQQTIFKLYLSNTDYINNWDLVDTSAEHIVGHYLLDKERDILYQLARSGNLWERRIAIMSTFHFIKKEEFGDTLELAGLLMDDEHDLIHKAVGWMLREVGKRNQAVEKEFLDQHISHMPRTMLRSAIEKLPEEQKQSYLFS